MKKKYFILLFSMMIASLMCVACGGDEEDTIVSPYTSSGKHLTRVIEGGIIFDFIYDSNLRVTQITRQGRPFRSYSYENNTITETNYDSDFTFTVIYTLENGRIVTVYNKGGDRTSTYEYKNGYLTTEKASNNRKLNYIWEDGKLVKVEYENEKTVEEYEYTDLICPQVFFPFGHYANMCGGFWGMSGYLGKSMKYLPSKYREDGYKESYKWVIEDGYPVKMNNITFEWE